MSQKADFMLINEQFERAFNDIFLNAVVMQSYRLKIILKKRESWV